jgi:hypothetical protein
MTNATDNVFRTGDLSTAIYLNASKALKYLGCEVVSGNRVEFTFFDPESLGERHEIDFKSGAQVPAIAIFASQRYLRQQMSKAQQQPQLSSNKLATFHQGAISNVVVDHNFNR